MIADHKEDFEGLTAHASAVLLDKLIQQNLPEDYKKLAEYARNVGERPRNFYNFSSKGRPTTSGPEKTCSIER